MQRRMRLVCGAVFVTMLLGVSLVPATTARDQNVCVSYGGVNYVERGSADCSSEEGSSSIAVGENTYSEAGTGGNTAVAVGEDISSYAHLDSSNSTAVTVGSGGASTDLEYGNGNTGIAIGELSFAGTYFGDNNTAIDVGGSGSGYAEVDAGDNNTAVAIGPDSITYIDNGDGNSGINLNPDVELDILSEDGCFVVVLPDGSTAGDDDCFDLYD